jgi:hypothetical protein
MSERQKYMKRATQVVHAVKLDLDCDGFTYRKWGGEQRCKPGDWLVCHPHEAETYTVDAVTFARTYRHLRDGAYVKTAPVWAERAAAAGRIETKEGTTGYAAGDYLVFNEEAGGDPYAVASTTFERMYEKVDS